MKRRIFVGGLTNDNFKLPPENTGLHFLRFGLKQDYPPIEEAIIGDMIRSKKSDDDGSIEEVHTYEPNNIVIADIGWLKANWSQVELWFKEGNEGSYITNVTYYTKE